MRSTGALLFVSLLVVSHSGSANRRQRSAWTDGAARSDSPATPQRMPARPHPGETPPKGTAVIKGQVTAGGTGAPVRRAQVRAMSMEGRGGGVTSTDNNGLFEINDLAAGRYNVTVMRRLRASGCPVSAGPAIRAHRSILLMARPPGK